MMYVNKFGALKITDELYESNDIPEETIDLWDSRNINEI